MSKLYTALATLVILVVMLIAAFGYGDHHGRGIEDAKWNKERVANAQAVAAQLARQQQQAEIYARQIHEANQDAQDAVAALAALRATAHPGIVCHRPPGTGPVPTVPAAPGGTTAGTGPLPPDVGFDPGKRAYPEVADACDAIVESYRHTLALWPN